MFYLPIPPLSPLYIIHIAKRNTANRNVRSSICKHMCIMINRIRNYYTICRKIVHVFGPAGFAYWLVPRSK
jgi:hypothetical protein